MVLNRLSRDPGRFSSDYRVKQWEIARCTLEMATHFTMSLVANGVGWKWEVGNRKCVQLGLLVGNANPPPKRPSENEQGSKLTQHQILNHDINRTF